MLAKTSRCISFLVEILPRRSANLMVVCVVGSPKFHFCEAAAFLSESINRVTITGINLRRGSDLMVLEAKRYPDIHDASPIVWRKIR
jgi:hypothetical protein